MIPQIGAVRAAVNVTNPCKLPGAPEAAARKAMAPTMPMINGREKWGSMTAKLSCAIQARKAEAGTAPSSSSTRNNAPAPPATPWLTSM